jgi:uncharacterized protein (TIGR03435 family)
MQRHPSPAAAVFILGLMAIPAGQAQSQPETASSPAFDTASIKPAPADARGYSIQPLPGRLHASNSTLKQLIGAAWQIYDFQISGGPKWIDSDKYDIEAKAPEGSRPTNAQLGAMLQELLAQRFQLEFRRETRDLPVYVLEVAKGGPKFQASKDPQAAPYFRVFQRRQITARTAPLAWLMEPLSILLGRPVLDKTGVTGVYDFTLEWMPDEAQVRSGETTVSTDSSNPSLGAALLEQLGLKLQGQKGPVQILIVERAEKASVN